MSAWAEGDQQDRQSAAVAMAELFDRCDGPQFIELDAQIRHGTHWWGVSAIENVKPAALTELTEVGSSRVAVLGAFSFYANGFLRERAVRMLADNDSRQGTPYLLLRNNDWVKPVREAARVAIRQQLESDCFGFTDRNLYLVIRLSEQSRGSHQDLVDLVADRFLAKSGLDTIERLLKNDNRLLRRRVLQWALQADVDVATPVALTGADSNDPVMRLGSIRWAASQLDKMDLRRLLDRHAGDSFLPVRREVLHARLTHFPDDAERYLIEALLDRGMTIREEARFHLRRRGTDNFASYYRTALADDRSLEVAILGLAETGDQSDAERAKGFANHHSARIRRAAVRAIGKLDAENHLDRLVVSLSDESTRVVREAVAALAPHILELDVNQLWERLATDRRRHIRLGILELVAQLPPWQKTPYLLDAAAANDVRIQSLARHEIERMYNRVFTKPTTEELQAIRRRLHENRSRLPGDFLNSFCAWIESCERKR